MANIRQATMEDLEDWSEFRTKLWPNTDDNHVSEIKAYFDGTSTDIKQAFILDNEYGRSVGFLELNIREFAEGSRHPRVPYVEAWYIDDAFQGQGYGKLLMNVAEKWAKEQGFSEIASDTEVTNIKSIAIHKQLGFRETERVVCFLKEIE